MKTPEKILIVKPSSLGDVVHSLPFLNAIGKCYPEAEIHWVIFKGFEGLLEGHTMIHKLWIVDKNSWTKFNRAKDTISEIKSLLRDLKEERFDLVVDLQGLLRSGIITAATGAPVRIGFKEAREGSRVFYTDKVPCGRDIHAVDRYLKIAEFLGCDISKVCFPFPAFESSSSFILHPSSFNSHNSSFEEYVVIVPGARWMTKRWPPKNFGKLASLLHLRSIIVGSKDDVNIANEIVTLSQGKSFSLAGKTDLKELIAVIKGSKFLVTNDSGPMHIAAALGVPVFAIFGPTDPARTGPYGKGHIIIREPVECAPCFKKTCGDIKCMKDLSAEKVYRIIERNPE
jgi:lipopolysaccharide heptosyltransferase I